MLIAEFSQSKQVANVLAARKVFDQKNNNSPSRPTPKVRLIPFDYSIYASVSLPTNHSNSSPTLKINVSIHCFFQITTTTAAAASATETSPKRLKEKNVKVTPKINHRLSRALVKVTRLQVDVNDNTPQSAHRTRNARVAEFKQTNVMTRNRLTVDRIKSPTQRLEHLKKVAPLVSNGDSNTSSRSSSRKSSISSNVSSPRRPNGLTSSPLTVNGRRSNRRDSSSSAPSTPTTRRKQVQNGPTKSITNKRVNGLKRDRRRNRSTSPLSDERTHTDTQSPQPKRRASKNVANKSPPASRARTTIDRNASKDRSSIASTASTTSSGTMDTSTASSIGIRGKKALNKSMPVSGESRKQTRDRSLPGARMSLRTRK